MRLRHFRGKGVHSPLVYSIVREVLMPGAKLSAEEQIRATRYLVNEKYAEFEGCKVLCVARYHGDKGTIKEMVAAHSGMSFETRKFLCLIYGDRFSKIHYKL